MAMGADMWSFRADQTDRSVAETNREAESPGEEGGREKRQRYCRYWHTYRHWWLSAVPWRSMAASDPSTAAINSYHMLIDGKSMSSTAVHLILPSLLADSCPALTLAVLI